MGRVICHICRPARALQKDQSQRRSIRHLLAVAAPDHSTRNSAQGQAAKNGAFATTRARLVCLRSGLTSTTISTPLRRRSRLRSIRGYAAEFGLTAAKGMAHLVPLLERIQADETLPALARELFASQAGEYAQLQAQIGEVEAKLTAWHRADECSRRLAKIPGIGPIGAVLLRMKAPDPAQFQSGRQFAAWIGLTPKDHSTAGKVRLGVITRAGDEALRSVLVVGATAVIQQALRSGKALPWLAGLLKRKPAKLAAVALANKTARIAWKVMLTGDAYRATSAAAA